MKKASLILSAAMMIAMMMNGCSGGSQVWMAKNLDVDKFRNGDTIPQAKTEEEWKSAVENKQPAWCYYNNSFKYFGEKYGKLYNWYAVNDPRGLAPEGWHIPTLEELEQFINFLLGGDDFRGGENLACSKMKSTSGWVEGGNGTNESGFNGLPGGYRGKSGTFDHILRVSGYWWSSTEYDSDFAWSLSINDNGKVYLNNEHKYLGMSVRCLMD